MMVADPTPSQPIHPLTDMPRGTVSLKRILNWAREHELTIIAQFTPHMGATYSVDIDGQPQHWVSDNYYNNKLTYVQRIDNPALRALREHIDKRIAAGEQPIAGIENHS